MQVHFLNEDQVVEFVQRAIEDKMLSANSSRSFLTQVCTPATFGLLSHAPLKFSEWRSGKTSCPYFVSCMSDYLGNLCSAHWGLPGWEGYVPV